MVPNKLNYYNSKLNMKAYYFTRINKNHKVDVKWAATQPIKQQMNLSALVQKQEKRTKKHCSIQCDGSAQIEVNSHRHHIAVVGINFIRSESAASNFNNFTCQTLYFLRSWNLIQPEIIGFSSKYANQAPINQKWTSNSNIVTDAPYANRNAQHFNWFAV